MLRRQQMRGAKLVVATTVLTSAIVTVMSYVLPETYAATGVGLCFLGATYLLVLRGSGDDKVHHYGLSLGGLLCSEPLSAKHLSIRALRALGWALAIGAIVFPLFWIGFALWWKPEQPFRWAPPESMTDEVMGQLLVIALPEEAFYRGYVQTALDDKWKSRINILGAQIGWALPLTSVLFALGHFLTQPHPNRLAVFFPALLFGWLRARTGGVGAPVALHAMSNIFSATLGRGYALFA